MTLLLGFIALTVLVITIGIYIIFPIGNLYRLI